MAIRARLWSALAAAALASAGCDKPKSGPIAVSAIGTPPELVNPNRIVPPPAAAFLLDATAQGLVRFDATGQIEPALAQSWTVSDDGRVYTFRIARTEWPNGDPVTADQVAARLRAASARASRNRLKPLLGSIAEIEGMTERVLEITLVSPRPNFLQLLAQPELAIVRNEAGTGPYRAEPADGALLLSVPPPEDEDEPDAPAPPEFLLRGEPAARAVARFAEGGAELVIGGHAGNLPIARAADPAGPALRFDPVSGLFGLAFTAPQGALAEPALRRALAMAIDRAAIVAALGVPDLQPRESLVPAGLQELPQPALPDWAGQPLPMRRSLAAQAVASAGGDGPLRVRVALPEGPGYRLVFALIRRDWRAIGVEAEAVGSDQPAELRLVDRVAPSATAAWYLREFACARGEYCSEEVEAALAAARLASGPERQAQLAIVDRALAEQAAFIPLSAPVRWSLVSPRLTGFQPNPFGRRFPGSLLAPPR